MFIEINGSVNSGRRLLTLSVWILGGTGHEWITENDKNNSQGSEYISALPDSKVKVGDTTNGPRIGYNISFESQELTMYGSECPLPAALVIQFMLGSMGCQSHLVPAAGIWDPNVGDEWTWKNTIGSRVTIEVPSPGQHQFYIWMREDGVRIDSIFLTQDSNVDPEELQEG